jgi:hypothetical protein
MHNIVGLQEIIGKRCFSKNYFAMIKSELYSFLKIYGFSPVKSWNQRSFSHAFPFQALIAADSSKRKALQY